MIAILKHITIECPGTITDFFAQSSWATKTFELSKGEKLPSLDACQGIISLGGPMNVYEEEKYPFLKEEDAFLKQALKKEIPILGICLGAQLLAKAAGAKVTQNKVREIGWYKVDVAQEAESDLLFRGAEKSLDVFQWHQDTFAVPEDGVLLVTSRDCKNQAFRIGKSAWGLQFHPEMTVEMLLDWLDYYKEDLDRKKLLDGFRSNKYHYGRQANLFYLNFTRSIQT